MVEPVLTAPDPDEAEISLFGPGYGECVVVHLGGGKWLINDSCLDETKRHPIALRYLAELGVDVGTQVAMVVASHWHDDHVRGLGAVYEACTSATFVCASALNSRESLRSRRRRLVTRHVLGRVSARSIAS